MKTKFTANNFDLKFNDIVTVLADSYNSSWAQFERIENVEITIEDIEKFTGEKQTLDVVCFEDKLAWDLCHGKEIIVVDTYEEESHTVSLKDFAKGLAKLANNYIENFANIMTERYDCIDTDAWLQMAVFGDWIYD